LLGVLFVAGSATAKSALLRLVTRTARVEGQVWESTFSATGYLVRRETVFVAPQTGRLVWVAAEGERVRAGSVVAEIANPRTRAAIDAQIEAARARLREFEVTATKEVGRLETALAAGARQLVELRSRLGRSGVTPGLETELGRVLFDQARLRDELEALAERHRQLMDELAAVQAQRAMAVATLTASQPGVVTYVLDGLEDRLEWTRLDRLSARTVFTLQLAPASVADGQDVNIGQRLFKLVDLSEAVLALAVPESKADDLIRGRRVGVRIAGTDQTRSGQIVDVHAGNPEGYALVLVALKDGLEAIGTRRQVEATIVKNSHEGVRVPRSALITQGDITGVFTVQKTLARFRPVTVVAESGRWVLVSGLGPGDEIITTPRWVREGQRVR
jgi:putative membrane fusion protein